MIYYDPQEFYETLVPEKILICLDYGTKKIGIAISDPGLSVSMPLTSLKGDTEKERLEALSKILSSYNPCAMVLGMPYNLAGEENPQTEIVLKFARILFAKFGLPIYLQDERTSSREADSILKSMGLKRKDRNEKDDPVAASIILDTALRTFSKFRRP